MTATATQMTEDGFRRWFAAVDLGPLEDVRAFVELHAIQNMEGVTDDPWLCARYTVEIWLDDTSSAEAFNAYRR